MGLFGKKKKKPVDDFDDDEGGEGGGRGGFDGPDMDGPGGGGGPGGFGGSDDNPYADDPAHKHFVKTLDTNGLVRHRRAFIRNSVYTIQQAKDLDAARLEKIGVFLDADRKKLLRIFKDTAPVESEVDKQREMEKQQQEEEEKKEKSKKKDKKEKKDKGDKKGKGSKKDKKEKKKKGKSGDDDEEDEENDKKSKKKGKGKKDKKEKKSTKDKKGKGKKKGKSKDPEGDGDDLELEDMLDEKPNKKGKSEKAKKGKKKGKGGKSDLEDGEPELDGLDDDMYDEEPKKGKKSKDKKPKKSKKDRKKGNASETDLDIDIGEDIDADIAELNEELEEKQEMSKKPPKPKGKKPRKPKPSEAVESDVEATDVEGLASDAEVKDDSKEELAAMEKAGIRAESEPKNEKPAEESGKDQPKRRMSQGSKAMQLLNEKLGKSSRRPSVVSGTEDEQEEEMWWQSLDSKPKQGLPSDVESHQGRKSSNRRARISTDAGAKNKKKLKVKPEFSTKLEYITDEENEVLQNFRKQNKKITRRKRQLPALQQPIPGTPLPYYAAPLTQIPVGAPPPPAVAPKDAVQRSVSLQPPGQSTAQASGEVQPSEIAVPNQILPYTPPQPVYWGQSYPYYPPGGDIYYTDVTNDTDTEGDSEYATDASAYNFSKYKYYKQKYNDYKKHKAKKKHHRRQKRTGKELPKRRHKRRVITETPNESEISLSEAHSTDVPRSRTRRPIVRKKSHGTSEKDLYVDLGKTEAISGDEAYTDGDVVSDREIHASYHDAAPMRYGNDDHYFNYANNGNEVTVVKQGRNKDDYRSEHKVNYFHSGGSNDFSTGYKSDTEMYALRRKLAEVGASKFYPLLLKQGVTSLKKCDMSTLEKLPIASKSRKRSLINTIMQIKKGTKNLKSRVYNYFSDSEVDEGDRAARKTARKSGSLGLKSALKGRSSSQPPKRASQNGNVSRSKSPKSRHYFEPAAQSDVNESDNDTDHVEAVEVKTEDPNDDAKSDKKSVTFNLNDEDEISLPSVSDTDYQSDSDMSLYSDYS